MNRDGVRIIGIDPGSVRCGYAVIDVLDASVCVVKCGTIDVRQNSLTFVDRLKYIYDRITDIIILTGPDAAAIETAFYSRNPQSLIKLSMARTAAMLAIINQRISISEYSPREVKQKTTGSGNATKQKVRLIIGSQLDINLENEPTDTSDAIAIAVFHYHCTMKGTNNFRNGLSKYTKGRKKKDWETFLLNNAEKIIRL